MNDSGFRDAADVELVAVENSSTLPRMKGITKLFYCIFRLMTHDAGLRVLMTVTSAC